MQDSETVFQHAERYTVRIRTAVSQAFIEDEQGSSIGSGFLVDAERGWIFTNAHVTSQSVAEIEAAFRNQAYVSAHRVYVDPEIDLAILRVSAVPKTASPSELECGELPMTGHPVGAYGHPWGLEYTGTRGIVSGGTAELVPDYLQTDAPINGGNSGGPLVSLRTGRVLGINTAKLAHKDAENTNFAVMARDACRIIELLSAGEDPAPPAPLVQFFDEESDGTLTVVESRLPPGAPALKRGDQILAVNGQPVSNAGEYSYALRGRLDEVTLRILRDTRILELTGPYPATPSVLSRKGISFGGMLLAPLAGVPADCLASAGNIAVHDYALGSRAEVVGVRFWDLIDRVNGEPVRSLAGLKAALEHADLSGGRVQVDFVREGDLPGEVRYIRRTFEAETPKVVRVETPSSAEQIARR